MKNHKRVSVPRLLTPVALAIMLAACSSAPPAPSVNIASTPSQSVHHYLMQADSSQGERQNDWLIMAFKASLRTQDVPQAELIANRLAKQTLTPPQQTEFQLAQAQLLVSQARYPEALQHLDFQPIWAQDNPAWLEFHQLKAELLTRQARYLDATRELILSAPYLLPSQQPMLSERIWNTLNQYSTDEIFQLQPQENETTLAGWLQLVQYAKRFSGDIGAMKFQMQQWLDANPSHPAAQYTPSSLHNILSLEIVVPQKPVLLLPLTGKYAKQAELIRDGFLMQMQNDPNNDPNASFTIIDTDTSSMEQIVQRLQNEQADFIIGPLLKQNVEALQQVQRTQPNPLPTLALNIPDQLEDGNQMCYFALSPEQEVAQAAKHLHQLGYQYPLFLAPKGALGERLTQAFSEEWQKYSQHAVAATQFGDRNQLQRTINTVFGLQDSQQRIAQMQSLLGLSMESQPRSRRDIDAVYIVASSGDLTLIKPFIEVAINPDVAPPKLFASSLSNSGSQQYEDLTGVAYSDIPLLVSPDPVIDEQINMLKPHASNVEKRLMALGMDAYSLLENMPNMKLISGYRIQGETGELSLDDQCLVQREIRWGEYGQATPVIAQPDTETMPSDELPTALPDDMAPLINSSL